MPKKSATEVKIDFLVKEIRELRNENIDVINYTNKGKGAIWILLVISAIISSGYNYFK